MQIRALSLIATTPDGEPSITLALGEGQSAPQVPFPIAGFLEGRQYDPDGSEPFHLVHRDAERPFDGIWLFRGRALDVKGSAVAPLDEIVVRLKHTVYKLERGFDKIQREVTAFENASSLGATPREPIPESTRLFVWQRDGGACVRCGSKERLEFDHIIPLRRGGSNTERNLQLLCESCNRSKGASI